MKPDERKPKIRVEIITNEEVQALLKKQFGANVDELTDIITTLALLQMQPVGKVS